MGITLLSLNRNATEPFRLWQMGRRSVPVPKVVARLEPRQGNSTSISALVFFAVPEVIRVLQTVLRDVGDLRKSQLFAPTTTSAHD